MINDTPNGICNWSSAPIFSGTSGSFATSSKPREALIPVHAYAHTAQLFWKILTKFVDRFFRKNRRSIAAHWYEIHRFSEDLVTHSAPFFLCDYLRKNLEVSQQLRGSGSPKGAGGKKWFETNERMDLSIPRYRVNGEQKAVQPITLSGVMDEVSLANLKQVCRYVIFHATFGHTWSNERQNEDFGEILYSCGGLRAGDCDGMAPECDLTIAPNSRIASETIWYSLMLSRAAYGFVTRNEERDIHPELVEAFRAKADEFKKHGIDVRKIQSRTNI